MRYKEQGKYLPRDADWQVACGPNPPWGRGTKQLLSAMASLSLTTISWVLSSVKGVVSVLYPDRLSPGSSHMGILLHLALWSHTSPLRPGHLSIHTLPYSVPYSAAPGSLSTWKKRHHYSFQRGQSRLSEPLCLDCTALWTAVYVLAGTCLSSAPLLSLSPSPLSLSASRFLRLRHVLHAVVAAKTVMKANLDGLYL